MTTEATKLTDFVIDSIKREQAKTAQSGRYLDDGLAAIVELHDLKKDYAKSDAAYSELADIYDEYLALAQARYAHRNIGKEIPVEQLNKKQLQATVRILLEIISGLANYDVGEHDYLAARLSDCYDKLVEVYDEAE